MKYGRTYTIKISGIKVRGASKYTTVTAKSNAYVIIKDTSGRIYADKNSRVEFGDDECEVYLDRELPDNGTFYYEIVNVKTRGSSKYTKVKGTFYI